VNYDLLEFVLAPPRMSSRARTAKQCCTTPRRGCHTPISVLLAADNADEHLKSLVAEPSGTPDWARPWRAHWDEQLQVSDNGLSPALDKYTDQSGIP